MERGNSRILAQSGAAPRLGSGFVRIAVAAALMVAGIIGAFGVAPDTTLEPVASQRVVRALDLPAIRVSQSEEGYWREEQVRRGDTLGSLLARLGVDDAVAQRFLRTDAGAQSLHALHPGRSFRALTDEDGRLIALRSASRAGEVLTVSGGETDEAPFVARTDSVDGDVSLELRANEIRTSLFAAADDVGVPDSVTSQLADIFAGDIDFHHDLHAGDRFTVVYEMRRIDGAPQGPGKIVAAEFVNDGVPYRAFRWQSSDGSEGYYDESGRSRRKAFLRSPLGFTRVTSGFSLARFHPFLQAWHAHKGADFAAPEGTPVHAAGAGIVIVAGEQTGYGNVVMLQHGPTYTTVYAHLSRFAKALKSGSHVGQGDVIGYVGDTGWATGPHLHYEFRVDNVQMNPLTVPLPDGEPVPANQRADYALGIRPFAAELSLGRGIVLAGGE
jgi:murein DD-endopeptidase MepM/ murein hydrolase activator NlpD